MKKILALTVILVLSIALMAGCGGGSGTSNTYDTGSFSVAIPDGWKEVPTSDLFDEYEGDVNPDSLGIYKGLKDELDILTCCGLTISYVEDASYLMSNKDFYDNVEELGEQTIGNYTWDVYNADAFGYPMTVLDTVNETFRIEVTINTTVGDNTISFDDADVQSIIESIAVDTAE